MADVATLQLLLSEAQNEISHLRTDVFNTRRVAEERRQTEQNLLKVNESLKSQLVQATAQLTELQTQVPQLQAAQAQVANLEQLSQQLKKDLNLALQAKKILQEELVAERQERQQVTSVKASLEAERARLLKAKDDLTATLRVAQRKAEEAEEEMLRAEEEAQALRAEVKALHAHASSGGSDPPAEPASYSSLYASQSYDQQWNTGHGVPVGDNDPAARRKMMEQVEHERSKAAALLASLQDSKADYMQLQQQVDMLAATNAQLKHQILQLTEELNQSQFASAVNRTSAGGVDASQSDTALAAQGLTQDSTADTNGIHLPQQAAPTHSAGANTDGLSMQPTAISDGGAAGAVEQQAMEVASKPGDLQFAVQKAVVTHHQHHASSSAASTDEAADEHRHLVMQVGKLKASRDKLLEQIDRQWEEIDRLIADNRGLSDELDRLQQLVSCWEWQAQHSLAAEERLKEMLEEAGGWAQDRASKRAAGDIEAALLTERARAAELELQVRALAAELLRSQQASKAFGKAVLPALSSIEHRLSHMQRPMAVQAGRTSAIAALTHNNGAVTTPKQQLQTVQ